MINTFWGSPGSRNGTGAAWQPRVDVIESDGGFRLFAELPGMSREDIQVTVKDHAVVLEGEKKPSYETPESGTSHRERFYGRFKRSFSLAENVEIDKMSAVYRNGVLELYVPKAEVAKPRQIEVTVE